MRLALRCACLVLGGACAAAAGAQATDDRRAIAQRHASPPSYQPRLPIMADRGPVSPSDIDEMMRALPIIDYKTSGREERERGFSFGLKPGKGVKAIARLRF